MTSHDSITHIIACRLQHTQDTAATIAALLSQSEAEQIELAAKQSDATVEIAAIVYRARRRAANALSNRTARQLAKQIIDQEAKVYAKLAQRPLCKSGRCCRAPYAPRQYPTPPATDHHSPRTED